MRSIITLFPPQNSTDFGFCKHIHHSQLIFNRDKILNPHLVWLGSEDIWEWIRINNALFSAGFLHLPYWSFFSLSLSLPKWHLPAWWTGMWMFQLLMVGLLNWFVDISKLLGRLFWKWKSVLTATILTETKTCSIKLHDNHFKRTSSNLYIIFL